MAITINDQPYTPTVKGQKLIITALSDNISEPGFKYKVVVADSLNSYTFYQTPNPNGMLIVDLYGYIKLVNAGMISTTVVHALTDQTAEPLEAGYTNLTVTIEEAWLVLGVLTDDPEDEGPEEIDDLYIWNGVAQATDGYKPNMVSRYALSTGAITKGWLSDRLWNTSRGFNGVDQSTYKVMIPVREKDYGVLSMVDFDTLTTAIKVVVTIYDSTETPHAFTITLASNFFNHLPVYPANLNISATSGWLKPSTYPGWKYITVVAQNSISAPVSVTYYLYNTAVYGQADCRHTNVRLGWKNFSGAWDYQNFIKKNEESLNVTRKKYTRVLGNYAQVSNSVGFNFTKQDPSLIDREPIVERMLEINSDWLTEGEFLFLRSLIVSQQVHWIQDDGSYIPVVVETNDYKMPRERNSKQKQLTLKLKYSNDLWA